MKRFRPAPTYANVMATVAVFIALGGSSYAVTLGKNSVKSKHIAKGQVKRSDIGRNAVDSSKVANGKLRAADFASGQLPAGPRGATGPAGPPGSPGSAVAYAHIDSGGNLDASRTRDLAATKLTVGSMCFRVNQAPKNITTAVEDIFDFVFATVDPVRIPSGCPAGTNAFARTVKYGAGAIEDAPYYIAFN